MSLKGEGPYPAPTRKSIQDLDAQIAGIQKSTRATVPALIPLHDIMRQRFRWYYKWSAFPASKVVNWLILFIYVFGASFVLFNIFSQPKAVLAAVTTYDLTGATSAAWQRTDGALTPVAPTAAGWTSYDSTQKTYAASQDANRNAWMGYPKPLYANLLYRFTINENIGDITHIDLTWIGYDTLENGGQYRFWLWNKSTSLWESVAVDTVAQSSDQTYTYALSSNFANYIDSSTKYLYLAAAGGYYDPPSSCPFVYSWDGKDYKWDSEAITRYVLPEWQGSQLSRLPNLKPVISCDKVNGCKTVYKVKIAEELPERSYFDKVSLVKVYHDKDSEVYSGMEENLSSIKDKIKPISAVDDTGKDVSALVNENDEKYWNKDDYTGTNYTDSNGDGMADSINPDDLYKYVELTYPKEQDAKEVKINFKVLELEQETWIWRNMVREMENRGILHQKAIDGSILKWFSEAPSMFYLQIWDGKEWQTKTVVMEYPAHKAADVVYKFDISDIQTDNLKIRFYGLPNEGGLDYAYIDYSSNSELKVEKIPLSKAEFKGADVTDKISAVDGNLQELREGSFKDEILLEFDENEQNVKDLLKNTLELLTASNEKNVTYFLDVNGYYKALGLENTDLTDEQISAILYEKATPNILVKKYQDKYNSSDEFHQTLWENYVKAVVTSTAAATYNQAHYRFRDDTTALNTTGGWLAAEDATISSVPKNTTRRLRTAIYNDGDSAAQVFKLQWRVAAGSWADLAAAGAVKWALSDRYANADGTCVAAPCLLTQQGSSTWIQGSGHENATTTSSVTFGDGKRHTEYEWAWQFDDTASGTYEFRVVKSDSSTITYSVTPSAGVAAAASFDQKHFIVRNDAAALNAASGSLPTGTWATDQDNLTYSNAAWATNYRIRFETANTAASAGNITRRLEYNENGAGWTQIQSGSGNVRLSLTGQYADSDATTSLLTATGTFTAGQGKESGSDTTQISLSGNYYTEDEYSIAFQTAAAGKSYQFRITNAGAALNTYTKTPTITVASVSVSGTSNEASGTVAVAINNALQSGKTGSISGAGPVYTWSITGLGANAGDIITVWIDGAADADESTGVTKYDGTDNITGMVLNRHVLSVGSVDDQSLIVTNLGQYDYNDDPNIMHTANSSVLNVDGGNSYSDETIDVLLGDTLTIGAAETLTTVNVSIEGNLTSSGAATYNITGTFTQSSGSFTAPTGTLTLYSTFYRTGGTFTHNSGTVKFMGNSNYAITTNNLTFNNLWFDRDSQDAVNYTITLNGSFSVEGDLKVRSQCNSYYQGGWPDPPEYYGLFILGSGSPTITVNGNLEFPSTPDQLGEVGFAGTAPNYGFTVDLKGNFILSDSNVGVYSNISFTDRTINPANQTITQDAGAISSGTWTVNKTNPSFPTVSLTTNLTGFNNLTLTAGTINLGTYNLIVNGAYNQTGGSFTASSGNMTVNGTFSLHGGSFTAPSGNMILNLPSGYAEAFYRSPAATFIHNSGTVKFMGNSNYAITTNNLTFNNLWFDRDSQTEVDYSITLNDSFSVDGDLKVQSQCNSYYQGGWPDPPEYYNLVIFGSGSPTITVNGNLEFPQTDPFGEVMFAGAPPNYGFTVDLKGNFILSDSNVGVNSNISFTDRTANPANQTITQDAGAISVGTWTVNKTNGSFPTVSQQTNLAVGGWGGGLALTSGVFYTNGHNLTVADTFSNNATLKVNGNETLTLTKDIDSGTVEYVGDGGSTSYTLFNYGNTFYSLLINSTSGTNIFSPDGALDINGSLSIDKGTLDVTVANYAINIGLDASRSNGSFNARSGTVTLDGGNQAISGSFSGSNAFYDLVKTTSGTNYTLTFAAGSTTEISHSVNWQGTVGHLLYLHSSTSPTFWNVKIPASKTLNYLSVKDSDNSTGVFADLSYATNTNEGNTINWFAPATPTNVTLSNPTADGFTASWTSTEPGFRVYVSTSSIPGGVCSAATYPFSPDYSPAVTTQIVTGRALNTQYCVKVTAWDGVNESLPAYSTTPIYTLSNTPLAPTLTTSSISVIKIVIDKNGNPEGPAPAGDTEYAIACDGTGTNWLQTGGASCSGSKVWKTYTNWGGGNGQNRTGLSANTNYTFSVLAQNGDNVENVSVGPSASKYTLIEAISGITWGTIATDSIQLSPSNTPPPSNLGSGSSGIQYCNTTTSTCYPASDPWQQNTNPWTSSSLTANTSYNFTIQSRNGNGTTTAAYGPSAKYTLANQVTGASASGDWDTPSGYHVDLGWDLNGATSVRVARVSPSGDVYTGSGTSTIDSSLSANTSYQYRIYSRNANGDENSNYVEVSDTTPPAAPTGLTHTANAASSITWDWADVTDATSYQVYFGTHSDSETTQVTGCTDVATSTCVATGLDVNTQQTVHVHAVNTNGKGANSSTASAYTSANTPLAPTLLAGDAQVAVEITAGDLNPASTKYAIQRTNPDTSTCWVQLAGGCLIGGGNEDWQTKASWAGHIDSSLTNGQTYIYQAKAENGDHLVSDDFTALGPSNSATPYTVMTVNTTTATNINIDSATLNGAIASTGGLNADHRGFKWNQGATCTGVNDIPEGPGSYGVGAFSQPIGTLSANTQYSYFAYALRSGSEFDGLCLSFYTLANQVTGATASGDWDTPSGYHVDVSWNLNGATSVRVARVSPSGDVYTGSGTSTIDSSLSANTSYQYRIYSRNANGDENSNYVEVSDTTPPAAPTGLAHTANTASSITLDWNDVTDATIYQVYSTAHADGETVQVTGCTDVASSTCVATGLSVNTQYTYHIHASNTNGKGANSSTASAYTSANTPLAPTLLAGDAQVAVEITAGDLNPASTKYAIQRTNHDTSTCWVQLAGGCLLGGGNEDWQTKASWAGHIDSSLTNGQTYIYQAKAENETHLVADDFTTLGPTNSATPYTVLTVNTLTKTNLDTTSFTANGQIASLGGGANATVRGFKYSQGATCGDTFDLHETGDYGIGEFSLPAPGSNPALSPNTQYSYRAYAVRNSEEPRYGSCQTFYTLANQIINASASGDYNETDDYHVDLAWNLNGATAARIHRLSPAEDIISSGTSYKDAGSCNTTYSYSIYALNGDGVENTQNPATAFDTTPPCAPANPNETNLTDISAKLNWEAVAGPLATYTVSFWTDAAPPSETSGINELYLAKSGLDPATLYYFKVRATNTNGTGAWGSIDSFATLAAVDRLLIQLPGQNFNPGVGITGQPDHQIAGQDFGAHLYAVDNVNQQVNTYTGTAQFTTYTDDLRQQFDPSSPYSPAPNTPIVGGHATPTFKFYRAGLHHVINATGSSGSSSEFVVEPAIASDIDSTATPDSQTVAVGDTATITIHIIDIYTNNVPLHNVTVTSDQAGDNIAVAGQTSSPDGITSATISSAAAHTSTLTVTVIDIPHNVTLVAHPKVIFAAGCSPDNPTNFHGTAGNRQVTLYWDNPAVCFEHIHVYRSLTAGVLGDLVYDNQAGPSLNDTDLTNGTTYYYTLKTFHGGNESSGTEQLALTPTNIQDNEPPTAPRNLRATDRQCYEISLAWDPSTDNVGVVGYLLYNADTGVQIGSSVDTRATLRNLQPDTTYRFLVRAYDAAGNISPPSNTLEVATRSDCGPPLPEQITFLVLANVPSEINAGEVFPNKVKVMAVDGGGAVVTTYTGSVYFTSSDTRADLACNKSNQYRFLLSDSGTHEFDGNGFRLYTAGTQILTVTDERVEGKAEIFVKSTGIPVIFQKAQSRVIDFTKNNASKLNLLVILIALALILIPALINLLISLGNLWPQLLYWLNQFLQLIGLRKKRKPWGVVFNSQTGQPISLAVVRIYDKEYNRLLETSVTDQNGRYGFLTRTGTFYLVVRKAGFIFPSQFRVSGFYENIYTGGNLEIKKKEEEAINLNIPLDPEIKPSISYKIFVIFLRINRILQKLRIPLLVIGLLFAVIMTIASYHILYALSIGLYVLLLLMEYLRTKKARPYGTVNDVFGHPLQLVIVRIFEKKTGRLIGTDVTDAEGRFKFLVNPGIYYLTAQKPGHLDFKSHIIYLEKERTMVASNIKLKKIIIKK